MPRKLHVTALSSRGFDADRELRTGPRLRSTVENSERRRHSGVQDRILHGGCTRCSNEGQLPRNTTPRLKRISRRRVRGNLRAISPQLGRLTFRPCGVQGSVLGDCAVLAKSHTPVSCKNYRAEASMQEYGATPLNDSISYHRGTAVHCT